MDRDLISAVAHSWHPVAAPVSDATVGRLLRRIGVRAGQRVLDLGCGRGAWLTRLVAEHPGVTGVGVDRSGPALAEARRAARGLEGRIEWVEADAAAWQGGDFDAVLCIGATHAFGGLEPALSALRRHLRPGGRVLLGDGVWERPPTPEATAVIGDDLATLAGLVAAAGRHDLEVTFGHVSTLEEWDDYEWCWTGAVTEWALDELAEPGDRRAALDAARGHRAAWLEGYRGQLGFVTVVLRDVGGASLSAP